ncbi:hypothetical protein C2845_PM01G38930 [Panicum miliaceum]|uniref:BTB/POZ and MATH domain-containing protein 2-like n=1 Tax=Panicum miliaceum TaxID=4540 RepID=A0A3L6THG7_PANMI|nr:hypothetical protein C2845_PM01G38930 [Panicum miliaceum]
MPTADNYTAASAAVGARSTGRHLLHIEGYSHIKALFNGESIPSLSFSVGGRAWCIWYYPRGADDLDRAGYDLAALYISLFLVLDDTIPEPAYAEATFHLLDQAEKPVQLCTHTTGLNEYSAAGARHGVRAFILRDCLEASGHLVHDCFRIRCDVSVRRQWYAETRPDAPPPSDLRRHLGDLLASREGPDVTFQVAGETFSAHRSVVAARSPVLKAKLSVGVGTAATCVRIDDVEPQVLEALLHFVYTDSLPEEVPGQDDGVFMAQRLLDAAGIYGVPRLRPVCEEKLCRQVEVNTAATMLLFAQQHSCPGLREACVDFLKCPRALNAVMVTDGFEHLVKSCPALLKDLISKLAAR